MSTVLYLCSEREATGCNARLFDKPGGTKIRCHHHADKVMEQAEEWQGATYAFQDPGADITPEQNAARIEQPLREVPVINPPPKEFSDEEKLSDAREEFKRLTGNYPDRRLGIKRLEEANQELIDAMNNPPEDDKSESEEEE